MVGFVCDSSTQQAETEGSPTIQGHLGYVASWRPARVTQTDAALLHKINKKSLVCARGSLGLIHFSHAWIQEHTSTECHLLDSLRSLRMCWAV